MISESEASKFFETIGAAVVSMTRDVKGKKSRAKLARGKAPTFDVPDG